MDVISTSSYRILIIDDEKDLRDLLEAFLHKEGFSTIIQAADGISGLQACRVENPDIILLDVMLPDLDGFEVCRRIREFSYTPVIFLSAREEEVDKLLGLGIGGDDYVTKPFSLKEVTFRIKAQLRRKQYLHISNDQSNSDLIKKQAAAAVTYGMGDSERTPVCYNFGNISINTMLSEVLKDEKSVELTAKEYQLLVHLARHRGRILSKCTLYEAVWGEDYMGDDNTIMVHIRHLREKLEDNPGNPRLIVTIKGLGYKLVAKGDTK